MMKMMFMIFPLHCIQRITQSSIKKNLDEVYHFHVDYYVIFVKIPPILT